MSTDKTGPHLPATGFAVTESGAVSATNGGTANSGIIVGDVRPEFHQHHHAAATPAPAWPQLVGQPPALASAFQPRPGLRDKIIGAPRQGDGAILASYSPKPAGPDDVRVDGRGIRVLAGGGGVGKSQLAAWFARRALSERTADLVLWVNAGTPDQVITAYARAASKADVPGVAGADPVADAKALLEWLHTTDRTWLVVLDDIADPAHVADWWPPQCPAGWTLATTRVQDCALISSGRQQVDIDVYNLDESVRYLTDRLTGAGRGHLLDNHASQVAAAVGHLPLALSLAAAYMINQEVTCGAYLARYTAGNDRLTDLMPPGVDPDAYGRPVTVTLLLALHAADRAEPVGLATPALLIAAMCDPNGHPNSLWATTAVAAYLTAYRRAATRKPWARWLRLRHRATRTITADQVYQALRLLHRYGLITHHPTNDARAVRIHTLTARAARESIPHAATNAALRATADALLALWPTNDHDATDLVAALRANTTTLADIAGDGLWHLKIHPLLDRTGTNLLQTGMHASAITFWYRIATQAQRLEGEEHPITLTARNNLAVAYLQAGRTAEAILDQELLVADCIRVLGENHRETLTARNNLATSYRHAGRNSEAIAIMERVVEVRERVLGREHADSFNARNNLACAYRKVGRTAEAIMIEERLLADSVRVLGDEHPDTLTARHNLAGSYRQAGRNPEAIAILEQVLAARHRVLGEEHPDTLTASNNLAGSYVQVGRGAEAIALLEQVVSARQRVLGEEHPDTLAACHNLAGCYSEVDRTAEALPIQERLIADAARVLGEQHPDTLLARNNLAYSYRRVGRTAEALAIQQQVVADMVRVLDDDHPDTLVARHNLAHSYWQAGRTLEAIAILEKVVADSARALGEQHPVTLTARENLAGSHAKVASVVGSDTAWSRVPEP